MPMRQRVFYLLPIVFFLLRPPPLPAADLETLWSEIQSSRLEPGRAVTVTNLVLETGEAELRIERGTFVPTTPVGGRPVEMVFAGEARLVLEPPDDIEAGQLELFTGSPSLDERITEAVLVLAVDAAADNLARRAAADLDPALGRRAEEIFRRWRQRPERRLLGVEAAIFRDAVGDPFYANYFAGWFRGEELGEFLYLFEPDVAEQITVGRFTPIEASDKEKRKLERRLHREQRRGRLIGLSVEDLGQWDTWMSAARRGREGAAQPGNRPFEPEHYALDVTLDGEDLRGRAEIRLRSLSSVARVVKLEIHADLRIERVSVGGRELAFRQWAGEVIVVLPESPAAGAELVLGVDYSGRILDKVDSRSWVLRDTTHWYPHAGRVDLATYEATFHWPDKLDLAAGGQRVDGGAEAGGRRFERRRLDHPTFGISFAVGKFRTTSSRTRHVEITLALDPLAHQLLDKDSREELLETIDDSLQYFEEIFGPYPLDQLVVATVPRGFSQSFLGFVTLATANVTDIDLLTLLLGIEDRRTVVAHEIAHQWWGHMVAWSSYRDQWISEAMANYAGLLYARKRLHQPIAIGPTTGWQSALTRTTDDGRPIESIGPLVLGERLASSRSGGAYEAIVYKKGAVVLDMLARNFGEDAFLQILRHLVKAVSFRPVSTEVFLDLIERITERDLDGFGRQFIYGTGLPEVYYTYEFRPAEGGQWRIEGEARQRSPCRYRYRVVERGGVLDVGRECPEQIEVADSALVVPVQVAVFDPAKAGAQARKARKRDAAEVGNAILQTHLLLSGESSDLDLTLDYEPKELWLDRGLQVFGRFFNERRHPKRMLYYRGLDLAAAGDESEAETLYRQALAAEVFAGPAYTDRDRGDFKNEGQGLDARIHLQLARLHLDQGGAVDARGAFDRAEKLTTGPLRYQLGGQLKTLEARLAIHAGDFERAYAILRKAILRRGEVDSAEGLLLLAIAARETDHRDDYQAAVDAAAAKGADVTLLSP